MENIERQTSQVDGNLDASSYMRDCKFVDIVVEKDLLEADLTVESQAECPKAAEGPTENNHEKKAGSTKGKKEKREKVKKKAEDDIRYMNQTNINTGSKESIPEGNVNGKRKRESGISSEIKIMNHVESLSNIHLSGGVVTQNECLAKDLEISVKKESSLSVQVHHKENPLEFCKDEEVEISVRKESSLLGKWDVVEVSTNHVLSEIVGERSEIFIPCEIKHSSHPCQMAGENVNIDSGLNLVRDETVLNEGQCSAEGGSIFAFCNAEGTSCLSSPSVKEAECLSKELGPNPGMTPIASITKKLIILDVNGLLANIVMPAPKDYRGDTHILGRAIFKRPFCDDFLKFCFQNFVVGVWSSRSKRIIERVVDYLLGDQKDKLLFCWDMSHSTQSGFNTLENIHKPLVFKELRKIWENDDPSLPWRSGVYNESNTLLLDDSPYKALLNPLCTAIFPSSFHYKDANDNSLGPGGDLRVYLEGLLSSENVQKYVEQHPFGQSAINETNLSWGFYSDVLQSVSNQMQDDTPSSGVSEPGTTGQGGELKYDGRTTQLQYRKNRYRY